MRLDGRIRRHKNGGSECPGSLLVPVERAEDIDHAKVLYLQARLRDIEDRYLKHMEHCESPVTPSEAAESERIAEAFAEARQDYA